MTARMAHEKIIGDKPNSPGLWHHKGRQIPAYMQRVINDLIEKGTPRQVAIPRGIGIVKNWAAGHDGKGNAMHPDTVAKAAAAVTEWEALKAATHAETAAKKAGGSNRRLAVEFSRVYNLEDISVRTGPFEDGRVVEAYAAVYDTPTEIRDQEGEYIEELDRSIFNKAVSDARPNGSRQNWKVGVFYNHARTIFGTPSDRHSEPVGVCLDIKPDARGLLTVTRYLPAADSILDAIREGAITAYSFSGAFMRSTVIDPSTGRETPVTGPARYRRSRSGALSKVRRQESSLREFGPTPFPAYDEAQVVGVRAEQVALALTTLDPAERGRLMELLRTDTLSVDDIPEFMPEDAIDTSSSKDGAVPGEPPASDDDEHSDRSHGRKLWDMRMHDQLEAAGIHLD